MKNHFLILFLFIAGTTFGNFKSNSNTENTDPYVVILLDTDALAGAGHLAVALYDPENSEAWYFSFNQEGYKEKRKASSLVEMQANLSRYGSQLYLKISETEYTDMLNRANSLYNNSYDLETNNCGHFVIDVVCEDLICGTDIYTYTGIPVNVYNKIMELNWSRAK